MIDQDRGMWSAEPGRAPRRIDTQTAHPARRYNYWLGGKDHFAADRASGDAVAAAFPTVRIAALENRAFMRRAVSFLTREAGVRQFLDIGTGIPAPNNTHEIAQAIAPESRVVYVDNDPIVLSHARALLNSSSEGATAYIEADLRDPERILSDPYVRKVLDFSEPVALLMIAILHFVPDSDDPYRAVGTLTDAMPSGSYLVASHTTADFATPEMVAAAQAHPTAGVYVRSREEFGRFFDGMSLLPPGIVSTVEWRPEDEPGARPTPVEASFYGAAAQLP